jgi:hypothetical protein
MFNEAELAQLSMWSAAGPFVQPDNKTRCLQLPLSKQCQHCELLNQSLALSTSIKAPNSCVPLPRNEFYVAPTCRVDHCDLALAQFPAVVRCNC